MVRKKIEQYNVTVLTDVDLTFAKSWDLGNCNNKSVFLVIGKDKKVKYVKAFDKNNKPNQADIDAVVGIVTALTK